MSIEVTSLQGCPKNFFIFFLFFFFSLNLPSRLLCDFYTCWPKIALRRQQHCLSAARGLRGKRERGRSQIEFAALPAGWFFVSAQQNLLPSICSAASFYVLKKLVERVRGLLAYAELLREHFLGQRVNSIKGKRLIDNFYPSTRLRHESTIPDSRLKPSSKPSQARIMSSSSDNELPLSAAEPRTPEKQPPPPPPPPHLHPSDVEARARPRGMMELRPSISSSQMPRGICSWTVWGSDPSCTRRQTRTTRMPPGANGSGRRVPTWLVGLWSCCKGGWSLAGPCLARPDPSSPRVGQAANHYLLACSGCMRTWASCLQGQEFCIQKPWAQGGVFLAPHSRMRLTLRSLAEQTPQACNSIFVCIRGTQQHPSWAPVTRTWMALQQKPHVHVCWEVLRPPLHPAGWDAPAAAGPSRAVPEAPTVEGVAPQSHAAAEAWERDLGCGEPSPRGCWGGARARATPPTY